MGMAVNNTKAIFEALIRKKTAFIRTPKIGDNIKEYTQKYKKRKLSPIIIIELILAIYFIFGIGISLYYMEIAAIPFQLMFLMGFGSIGVLSLRHALSRG